MQPEDVMAQFEHGVTDSGIEIYSLHRSVPWVACTVIVHAGAIHDPDDLHGLAHLSEHCCTSSFKEDKLALIDWAKRFGGDFNPGVTNFQVTKYGFKLPLESKTLETGFRILSEMLFGLAEKSALTGERKRVLREWEDDAV